MENEFLINQGKGQVTRPKSRQANSLLLHGFLTRLQISFLLKSSIVTSHLRAASTSFGLPDGRYGRDPVLYFQPVG